MEQERFEKLLETMANQKSIEARTNPPTLSPIYTIFERIKHHLPKPVPLRTNYGPDLNDYE